MLLCVGSIQEAKRVRWWLGMADRATPKDRARRSVLEDLVESITDQTAFRRAAAFFYDACIVPGVSDPQTAVADYAMRGLSTPQCAAIAELLAARPPLDGERFHPANRIQNSYFYPRGEGLTPHALRFPSQRSFLGSSTWDHNDVLLVPMWIDGKILGHISVDDPRDGCRPSGDLLRRLEDLARVSAVALRTSCDLEQLSETHRIFRLLAESAMTGVLVVQDDAIRYVNTRAVEIFGYDRQDLLALVPWWQIFHPDDRPAVWQNDEGSLAKARTVRAIRRDGRMVWLALGAQELQYRDGAALAVQFFDVTDRVEVEEQLKERALRDPLTGLLNRAYFEDAALSELQRSRRYKRPFTLMMADLARFKHVNDRFGHQEGDRILIGISGALVHQLRESDWVVRYGGDEFLFVLPETGGELETLVTRLGAAVSAWCGENAPEIDLGIDFGWATWSPESDRPIGQLVREADAMLYLKKDERTDPR